MEVMGCWLLVVGTPYRVEIEWEFAHEEKAHQTGENRKFQRRKRYVDVTAIIFTGTFTWHQCYLYWRRLMVVISGWSFVVLWFQISQRLVLRWNRSSHRSMTEPFLLSIRVTRSTEKQVPSFALHSLTATDLPELMDTLLWKQQKKLQRKNDGLQVTLSIQKYAVLVIS